jgi:hypothetical protein
MRIAGVKPAILGWRLYQNQSGDPLGGRCFVFPSSYLQASLHWRPGKQKQVAYCNLPD